MEKKKLILVSLDALSSTDLDYVKTLPHFAQIMKEGAYCANVHSVYPSLTFPSHASIVTGCYPDAHGIVNNYLFDPFEKLPKWNFYATNLKRKALWDYANAHQKEVLSMSWPVSAGAAIKYSMPEMSPAKPKVWNMDSFIKQIKVLQKYGTPGFAAKTLLKDRELPRAWFLGKQPQLDKCMMQLFLDAVSRYEFDIALLHIYGLDDEKHVRGIDSEYCRSYLRLYDKLVGELMTYTSDRQQENITLLFTGDHSQKEVTYAIHGNMILEQLGYCNYQNKQLKDYKAYLDSCDGMAYIYLHTENKKEVKDKIKEVFQVHPGVRMVMEPEEFIAFGCDSQADLVLEAKDGYYFESGYAQHAGEDGVVPSHYMGVHGYLPDGKDYQTMLFCWGKDVNSVRVEQMGIVDILPTVCSWMDMHIEPVDGIARTELWNYADKERAE